MRFTIVLLAGVNFALFGLALRTVFAGDDRRPFATQLLVAIGVAFSCLHLYLLSTAPLLPRNVSLGCGLYLLAFVLFTWAARSVRGRNFRLAYAPGSPPPVFSGGPYRWIRHPFYLSYTVAWFAAVVALADRRLLLTPFVMLGFYVAAAYREERQMLRGPAAAEYRAYRRYAGVVIPHFWA